MTLWADFHHIAGELRNGGAQSVQLVRTGNAAAIRRELWAESVGDVDNVPFSADFANLSSRSPDRFCSSYQIRMRITKIILCYLTCLELAEQGFFSQEVVNAR